MEYFWIIFIVAVASLIKGITGFGFALVTLSFLMNWYSPKELISVLVMCNLVALTIIVLQRVYEYYEHRIIYTVSIANHTFIA